MTLWQLEYFEEGSRNAYRIEKYFSVEKKNAAVARYLRLGGDDVLHITSKHGLDYIRFWLGIFCFRLIGSRVLQPSIALSQDAKVGMK